MKYEIYHGSYTSAINEVLNVLAKKGYYLDKQDVWNEISTGSGRPKNGNTVRFNLPLYDSDGLPAKQGIAFQITDLGKSYELNMYESQWKLKDYMYDFVEIQESVKEENNTMIKLKEGQEVLAKDGSKYLVEKGDNIVSSSKNPPKKQLKESSRDAEIIVEFLNKSTKYMAYYYESDSYREGHSITEFYNDYSDYGCEPDLFMVSHDYVSDFVLGTDSNKEQGVLENFYSMLSESGEFDLDDEESIILDGISTLELDREPIFHIERLDTNMQEIGKNIHLVYDDVDDLLYDLNLQHNSTTYEFTLKDMIQWIENMDGNFELKTFEVEYIGDNQLEFHIDRYHDIVYFKISTCKKAGATLSKEALERLAIFMKKNLK